MAPRSSDCHSPTPCRHRDLLLLLSSNVCELLSAVKALQEPRSSLSLTEPFIRRTVTEHAKKLGGLLLWFPAWQK